MNRDNGENFHFFVLSFFSKSKKIDFAIPRYELFWTSKNGYFERILTVFSTIFNFFYEWPWNMEMGSS